MGHPTSTSSSTSSLPTFPERRFGLASLAPSSALTAVPRSSASAGSPLGRNTETRSGVACSAGRPVGLPEPIHQDADSCVLGGPSHDGEAVEHLVEAEPLG